MKIQEIATKTGRSLAAVRMAARRAGFELKSGKAGNDFNQKQVAQIEKKL